MDNIKPFRGLRQFSDDSQVETNDFTLYHSSKCSLLQYQQNHGLSFDVDPCLYVYKYKSLEISTFGIISLIPQELISNKLKKHELIYADKVKDQINIFDSSGIQVNPILVLHKDNNKITSVLTEMLKDKQPDMDRHLSGEHHQVWVVKDKRHIDNLKKHYNQIKNFYLADGHHRVAALENLVGNKKTLLSPAGIMSYLVSESQVLLKSYNKVLKNLNGFTLENFLKTINKNFEVRLLKNPVSISDDKFAMYVDQSWYELQLKSTLLYGKKNVELLQPIVLYEYLFSLVFALNPQQKDTTILSFADGQSFIDLRTYVDNNGYSAGFYCNPLKVKDIFKIADIGKILPPNSTYFKPKLINGLISMLLSDGSL